MFLDKVECLSEFMSRRVVVHSPDPRFTVRIRCPLVRGPRRCPAPHRAGRGGACGAENRDGVDRLAGGQRARHFLGHPRAVSDDRTLQRRIAKHAPANVAHRALGRAARRVRRCDDSHPVHVVALLVAIGLLDVSG